MSEFLTIEVHQEFAKRVEEENDRQNHRLNELEANVKEIGRLTTSVEKMATQMEVMTKEITKQGERLEEIEQKPGKRWETVVGGIITGVIGILIGLLSAGIIK